MDSFGVTEHPIDIKNEEALIEDNSFLSKDEKLQTVKARVGQGKYRKQLLEQCPFCPVTLVSDDRLLIASHIKPWAASEQAEKIDPKNGFMFTPTIDYLFDSGFITFEDNKKMVVSPWLSKPTINRLNIKPLKIIDQLPIIGRERYLNYHRNNVFKA
jgi:predicted restriction endonuclease